MPMGGGGLEEMVGDPCLFTYRAPGPFLFSLVSETKFGHLHACAAPRGTTGDAGAAARDGAAGGGPSDGAGVRRLHHQAVLLPLLH